MKEMILTRIHRYVLQQLLKKLNLSNINRACQEKEDFRGRQGPQFMCINQLQV